MIELVELKNWGTGIHPDNGYLPPERQTLHLRGEVFGHPRIEDGKKIVTSRVLAAEGRIITTKSRKYLLVGPPHPEYVEYLKSIGYALNDANPIMVRTS